MGRNIKDTDIIRFIDELPGGSVPQYARLLATSPTRINRILGDGDANRLVLQKKVMSPVVGKVPSWAPEGHPRGEIDAQNITTLPPFVNDLLDAMHPSYRDDGFLMFKTLVEMASGRKGFEAGVTEITEMYSDVSHHVAGLEHQLSDNRERLLLLQQEKTFWRQTVRDVAENNGIELPPMMSAELRIGDLRDRSDKLDSEAAADANVVDAEAA